MDLDDEELEATRRLNEVAKDSNIDEDKDVIILKNFIEIFNERKTKGDIATIDVLGEEIYSLENILAKREADKKRIKELKVENLRLKGRIDVTNWQEKTVYESLKEKYIPIQKVKDKIEEYKDTAKRIAGTYQYADSGDDLLEKRNRVIELKNKAEVLEDLLEDK